MNPPSPHPSPGLADTVFAAEMLVEKYLHGVRIDSFLIKHFRNYTSWRMQRIVRAGQATVDGEKVPLEQRVFTGQRVTVRLIEPPDKLLEPDLSPLAILFEDEWLIAVNKPPALVVHPTGVTGAGTLANVLQHYLDGQTARRGILRPGIVHRLDRDTSGVILVAKDHLSHRLLSIEFQAERVSKTYLALVEGVVRADAGRIDAAIGRYSARNCALMSARPDARNAKAALTLFEVVERFEGHTLVRAKPRTGRLHQIRVHLASIGHPVVGDPFYAAFGAIKPRPDLPDDPEELEALGSDGSESRLIGRQALHAERIACAHPMTREWSEYSAPLPADFESAVAILRRGGPIGL